MHLVIRARRDGDLVVAVAVDDDQRDPRGDAAEPLHGGDVDALGAQRVERLGAEVVVPDRADERDRGAGARRGDRLVGALAAAAALEPPAGDRLAAAGQAARRGRRGRR